jgi:Flp pilus assembly protein TadD
MTMMRSWPTLFLALFLTACGVAPEQTSTTAGFSLAARAQEQGDHGTAIGLFNKQLASNPGSVKALVGLGRSYTELGQFARAQLSLDQAKERSPNDRNLQLEYARLYLATGAHDSALSAVDAALLKGKDLNAYILKGLILDASGDHSNALAAYREALKINPTDFTLLSNYGLSLALSGNTSQAISILTDLTKAPEANARTRGNLAIALGLNGDEALARQVLSQDLSPSEIEDNIRYYRTLKAKLVTQGAAV